MRKLLTPLLGLWLFVVVVSASAGFVLQSYESTKVTGYYQDLCTSLSGCCPEEKAQHMPQGYCPEHVTSRGFPIDITSVHGDAAENQVVALNTAFFVIVGSTLYGLVIGVYLLLRRRKKKTS